MNVPAIPRVSGLRQIRGAILILFALVALLYAVAVFGFLANRQATDSLCVLRADLQTRVATSRQFLKDHPNGFAGIPVKAIRDGIRNQESTIGALSGLSCPNP